MRSALLHRKPDDRIGDELPAGLGGLALQETQALVHGGFAGHNRDTEGLCEQGRESGCDNQLPPNHI